MWMGPPVRITLREDLTRYDSRLTPGATGVLVPYWVTGAWGKNFRFGAVRFDNGGPTIDMVLDNLEFDQAGVDSLDVGVTLNEAILQKTVRNVRVFRNAEGKFSRLTYEFSPGGPEFLNEEDFITTGTEFVQDAVRLLEMFKAWGIKVSPGV